MSRTFLWIVVVLFTAAYPIHAAIFIVTKIADTNDGTCDSDCSLREAVAAANGSATNDTVAFALPLFSSPQTITLGGTEIVIANNGTMTILGTGANRLTISGNNTSRIFANSSATTVISDIRFTGGNGVGAVNTNSGGALMNDLGNLTLMNSIVTGNTTTGTSGGIRNSGTNSTMTIINCVVSNNTSGSSAGGLQNFSTSTLTVVNSTFTGNTSAGSTGGGAMQLNGTARITNTTIAGNNSPAGSGGGIQSNGSLLVLTNVTISGNTSTNNGGGFHRGTTNVNGFIRNSIIAGNTGGAGTGDVTNSAGGIDSLGNNIIGVVGTSTGWEMTDQQNVDPKLGPLGFHGGFGMTFLPLAASTAIDMGDNCVLTATCPTQNAAGVVTTDERGAPRPSGSTVDVGAVESAGSFYAVVPSATAGVPYNFTVVPANNGFTYMLNSGSFGGIGLSTSTSTALTGTANFPGVFSGLVQIVGAPGQAFQNYRINVLSDPNVVSVSGRVVTSTGDGVGKAIVRIVAANGAEVSATTNPFGYFRIDGVPAGLAGTLTVTSKTDQMFTPQLVVVSDVIDGLEIRAAAMAMKQ